MNSSAATTTATNKNLSTDLDLFMMSSPPTQQLPIAFPTQPQQQQSFVHQQMFQQPMMFSSNQQQFNKPNNNSFNVS